MNQNRAYYQNNNIDSRRKILRILVAIMMVFSTLSLLAIFATNVTAAQLGPADVTISVVGDSKDYGEPGDWVSFTIQLQNDNSNTDAWVNLTLSGGTTNPTTGSNWNSSLEKYNNIVVLDGGRTTNVRLDVRVGQEIFNASSKEGHVERVTIRGEFYDKGDQTYEVAGTLYQTVDVEVLQVWEFEFTNKVGEPQTKQPNTAGQVQFNFTINNTGNGQDTFTFNVVGAPGTALLPTTNVNAYSLKDVTLYINNIEEDTEAGIHYVIVKAQSENTSIAERQAGVNVQIPEKYQLDLSTNEPTTKNVEPDDVVNYNFTIKNEGNTDDNIQLSSGFIGSAQFWEVDIIYPSSPKTIDRNETLNLRLQISAPANATYPKTVRAYLNVSSTNDPNVYQYIDTIKAKILQINDVNIITDNQKTLNASHQASFEITVQNKGNGEDTFEFDLLGSFPAGELWSYKFSPPSATLGPKGQGNNQATVYFNVTGPENARFGNFKLNITATSEEDQNVFDKEEIIISVDELYNIDITRLAKEKWQPYPGDTISIRLRGVNTGNFKDTFNLDVDVPTGAEAWISNFEPQLFLDLDPDEESYAYFNITVDEDAPQGIYLFTIKCISSSDSTKEDSFKLNLSVKRKYDIELTFIGDDSLKADPGSSADFQLLVQNKGTGSCNITMESDILFEYKSYISVKITPSSFELPLATSSQVVWVNATPSESNPLAPMNQTGIPITIHANITEKEGGPEASEIIEVKVNQVYGVKVYADTLNVNPDPGTTIFFNVTITNDGNGEDSFGIALPAVRTGWDVEALDPVTMLPKYNTEKLIQDEEERIMIRVYIPSTEAHISVEFPVNVSSRGNTSKYQIEKVNVNVGITKGVKFVGDNSTEVEPGSFVLINITLENIGTINDTYTLDVIGSVPDFIDYEPLPTMDIELGKRNFTLFNVSVSDTEVETLPKYAYLTLEAVNFDKSVNVQQMFTLDITEVRSVRITSKPNWQKEKPNKILTYNLTIENTGTGDDRFALTILSNPPYSGWVRLLDDETESLGPGEITYIDVEVDIPPKQQPGEFSISIKAESKENPEKINITTFRASIEQIFKLEVTVTPKTQTVDPGENATYYISVKNDGTGIDNVTLEDEVTENPNSVSFGIFSTQYLLLTPGQTKSVTYILTTVDEPEAGELIPKIDITATSEDDTSEPAAADTDNFELEINPTVDIELDVDDIKKDVTPNLRGTKAEVEYSVTIRNLGLDADSFDLTEQNNHGYKVDISPSSVGPINTDATVTVTVKITIDNKALMSTVDFFTNITATSRTNEEKSETITLKTRIEQAYGVELQVLDERIETEDVLIGTSRTVTFQVDVQNIGTGEDTFKLELTGDYAHWATLSKSSYPTLDSKDTETLNVTVKVPRETEIGDIPITLKAISRGDDDQYKDTEDALDEVTLTVEVTQFYEVALTTGETRETGVPGDNVEFTVTVTNRGNGEDKVELVRRDYNINWDWRFDTSATFELKPSGTIENNKRTDIKDVVISVDIPDDEHGESGYYNISIYVYSTDTPTGRVIQNDGEPIIFTIKVDPVYSIELIKDYPTSSDGEKVDPGDYVEYQFTIKNKGNIDDTFSITVSGTKSGWVVLQQTSIDIGPYESESFEIIVDIPDLTEVDAKDIEAKKYTITVKVTSEGDADKYQEYDISPNINKEYNIDVDSDLQLDIDGTSGMITVNPNADPNYERFTLTLTNDGNTRDVVELSTRTSDWTVKFDSQATKKVTIEIGVSVSVTVEVTAPDDAKDGDRETLIITAKSEDDKTKTTFNVKGEVETAVIQFGDLTIDGDKSVGSKVTIKLVVRNTGNVDAEDIEVKFYDKDKAINTEKIDTLSKNSEEEISFSYEIKEGDHEIRAQTEWSDDTIKKSESFSAASEFLPGNLLWIVIIVLMIIIFIIGVALASVSYKRSIPEHLREEIAMAKQARRMGKSPEEIEDMRRKKYEKQMIDKKRPGAGAPGAEEGLRPPPTLPAASEDKLLPPARGKGKKAEGDKPVKIKCPKCDKIQKVTSTKRPIEFLCSNCGMKLVLKK